jgi:hypothetical protein
MVRTKIVLICLISFFGIPQALSDEAEQERQFLSLVAEEGLENVLLRLTKKWVEKFPIVDPYQFESGVQWTATDGAAWGNTLNWFYHADVKYPSTDELLARKLEQQCVESGRIYTRNGVRMRYHLINSNGVPVGGFTIDQEACVLYIASK